MNANSNIKHKPLAIALVFLLVLSVFAPYLPGNTAAKAYAASETQYFYNNTDVNLGAGFSATRLGAYQIVGASASDMSAVAYCMDFSKEGPAGGTYKLSASKPDQVISYLTAYGYPNRTFKDDPKHSRIITQIAIWCYFSESTVDAYFDRNNYPESTLQEADEFLEEAKAYAADVKAGKKPAFSCGWIYTTTDLTSEGKARQRMLLTEPGKGKVQVNKGYATVPLSASNPNYSLQGAEYTVYSDSDLKNKVGTLTTGASGKSGSLDLYPGTYYVKETKPSKNCTLDPKTYTVKVTTGNTAVAESTETPKPGKGKIVKISAHDPISKGNESYSLKGAVYGVYQTEGQAKVASKENPGSPVVKLTTGENGDSNVADLFAWNYFVKELEAPQGYALDKTVYRLNVEVDKTATLETKDMPESASVELLLQKVDAETMKPKAQGAAGIQDASYEVSYYAGQFETESQAKAANVTTRTWVFKTDKDGQIKLDDDHKVSGDELYKNAAGKYCVPVGTVIIKETAASEGYKLDKQTYVHNIPAVANGPENLDYGNIVTSPEEVKRADMMGIKIGDTNMKRLAGVPFLLTSKTTGEAHIIVTDENGQFATASDWATRDESTNANDVALSEDGKVDESKLSDEAGIWFNGYNDPETGAPASNNKRALPYDIYEMKELRCDANKGYDLITFEFKVKKEGVVNLGTLTDDQPEVPEIGTTAIDKSTGGHIGFADKEVTIVDTVQYDGLTKGQEYKLTGTLMDKETGKAIEIDGKPITAETGFKAKSKTGTVDVNFTFPGSAVKGKTTVVFESLYQEKLEVAVHADIEDEDQTVVFPEIGTKAALMKDGSILDTVSYSNLVPGKNYEMVAHLVDKESGKAINGTETTVKFKPSEANGSMEVAIDTTKVKGKTVVVFEECRLDGKVIAEHKDLKDEHQTVKVPGEPEKPTAPDTPKSVPKTGDNSKLGLLICLLLISGGTLGMALKRKSKNE